jgi:hypothetical protein
MKKKYYGEFHPEYAKTMSNLCIALNNFGEYDIAKEYY